MSAPRLSDLRACLDGVIPAMLCTCDLAGVPNVAYISQVFYVDERHVALSFQFFNKTRQNILAHPRATVLLLDPRTVEYWRLHIRYLRTESEGPVFESMKAQLAGIASHAGLADVFRLRGSDIYEVEAIEPVPGEPLPPPPERAGWLPALRACGERLSRCASLDDALEALLATLTGPLDIAHAMVLMLDEQSQCLYTVASRGYATSGVGSEIRMGQGVIGVAARERTPVRISHMTNAAHYSQAMRSSFEQDAHDVEPATEIPYPGLPQPHSQLAVPVQAAGRLLGVVFAESPHDLRFSHRDEDALVVLAGHLGAIMGLLQSVGEAAEAEVAAPAQPRPSRGEALRVKRFAANESIFLGEDYLIKGVAGAILWKLVRDHVAEGRTEFTNRELRLDPSLGLPDVTDNLEARLLLLQRRLQEHGPHVRIEKTGRGRFRLVVARPLQLVEA
ncbi:GAF domain-containing protein [Ramlibacter humi]|uniref:GAF domain-containing protein n=1 Tax=Ramlibacter humi TaxID=2530451 RepID=A0A4Z0BZ98_9BURK|nr:GAF domain-containing protein [Ramlibacter humi]TFZ03610.1 GAF domain-containing protein [Ramlibacter humi]